jgi:hypothetical protein
LDSIFTMVSWTLGLPPLGLLRLYLWLWLLPSRLDLTLTTYVCCCLSVLSSRLDTQPPMVNYMLHWSWLWLVPSRLDTILLVIMLLYLWLWLLAAGPQARLQASHSVMSRALLLKTH